MNPGHVYILGSPTGVLYIGVTSNLQSRIWEHKNKIRPGFATDYNCTRLLYAEPFNTITEAIARETQLKGWTRKKKVALIAKQNPAFSDLAENWLTPPPQPQPIHPRAVKTSIALKLPRLPKEEVILSEAAQPRSRRTCHTLNSPQPPRPSSPRPPASNHQHAHPADPPQQTQPPPPLP